MRPTTPAALTATVAALALPTPVAARPAPAPPAATTAPVAVAASATSRERAVRVLINRIRARHGLRPLRPEPHLARAARRHSADMRRRGFFAHASPDGRTAAARLRAAGYRGDAIAETIAWGSGALSRPRAIVRGWMTSRPHRRTLLSRRYREIGVGIARAGREAWATADFGAR